MTSWLLGLVVPMPTLPSTLRSPLAVMLVALRGPSTVALPAVMLFALRGPLAVMLLALRGPLTVALPAVTPPLTVMLLTFTGPLTVALPAVTPPLAVMLLTFTGPLNVALVAVTPSLAVKLPALVSITTLSVPVPWRATIFSAPRETLAKLVPSSRSRWISSVALGTVTSMPPLA